MQKVIIQVKNICLMKFSIFFNLKILNFDYFFFSNKEEKKEWLEQDPSDRKLNFIPKKFDCLRKIHGYDKFINERFERCLDLYMCPRVRKKKLNIDPKSLIPKLPKP